MRKLVRDKIPDIMKKELGEDKSTSELGLRKMSEWEYTYALQLKLKEEWSEAWEDPCPEEFADCLEVLMAAAEYHGVDWESVLEARKNKSGRKGGFKEMWEYTLKK
tara:strand:- start:1048 stop:1365 length:318 start_codon:yes stop_codon:yes gene_type:complete